MRRSSGVLGFGQHGSTFGGNPVACAGAKYVLDHVMDETFLKAVNEKSAYMIEKLNADASDQVSDRSGSDAWRRTSGGYDGRRSSSEMCREGTVGTDSEDKAQIPSAAYHRQRGN